ncbi:MAG TPA: response regulator [bacterium]|nr:response regulator [bacterium]HQI49688.1 response regulator [bacterium]HQJ65856.1 response regulator [bacterium]
MIQSRDARILVVDDEEIIRIGCQRILQSPNFKVDLAENGRIGWEMIQKSPYDMILVDLMMPEMGGLEVLEKVQGYDDQIITIIITGFATIETAVDAMRKGAYDYLPKPFSPDELRTKIRRGLEKRWLLLEAEALRQERDRNLLELSNEKSRTMTLINCMSEGLIATNRAGKIVLMNPAAQQLLNLNMENSVGLTVEGLLGNPELEKLIAGELERVTRTASMTRAEFAAAEGRFLQANTAPLHDDKGELWGTVTVLVDITEDKKLEQLKSDFVNLVSHELKSPVAAIAGYLNLILDGLTAGHPEKEKEIITRSRDKAESLLLLINDLLEMSRAERHAAAKVMEPVQLGPILEETLQFYQNEATAKSLTVTLEGVEGLPEVVGNRDDLARLFANLISNAIKYTPPQGQVKVSGRHRDGHIEIAVTDTGIGMSKEDLQKIFGEFFRGRNALARKISGTGLGLAICRRIIDDHHGQITVESELDRGSTFSVILPARSGQ